MIGSDYQATIPNLGAYDNTLTYGENIKITYIKYYQVSNCRPDHLFFFEDFSPPGCFY